MASIIFGAAWYRFLGLDGTEFSAGWLTGPLLHLQFSGTLLFTFALLVAFAYPRASATMTLAAVLCCLPLHLYFLVPGLFPGVRSVPMQSYFLFNHLDFWSAIALGGVTWVAVSALRNTDRG